MSDLLLDIRNLSVQFGAADRAVNALNQVDLQLYRGRTLGLVGESGSGKTTLAHSLMQLLPPAATLQGTAFWQESSGDHFDIFSLKDSALNNFRAFKAAMIFQEPMSALNPIMTCGEQVAEVLRRHADQELSTAKKLSGNALSESVLYWLEQVQLPDPERFLKAFPHELSGGQKQRVMIAMALAGRPKLLIADEPTTALDAGVQRSILELLRSLQAQFQLTMLLVSHDLAVVRACCDEVAVLRAGCLLEYGSTEAVIRQPQHSYTRALLACSPSLHRRYEKLPVVDDIDNFQPVITDARVLAARHQTLSEQAPLLAFQAVSVRYPGVKALDGVSFNLYPGETLGIAGESGSGKSTLGRAAACLAEIQEGRVCYEGQSLHTLSPEALMPYRRKIQMVFQDPYAALNPRLRAGTMLEEPLKVHGIGADATERRRRVQELLEMVELPPDAAERFPREFSGGQRQRLVIARALALSPRLLICDEITASLDVSVQATILNLIKDLGRRLNLSCLFISHDLGVLRQMSDRVLVLHAGKVEAIGLPDEILETPQSDYVKSLLAAVYTND